MSLEYTLENGRYTLYHRGVRVVHSTEVGIVIDLHTGSALKHGAPDLVQTYFDVARKSFMDGGYIQEANDLVFVTGQFDLEELNKMVGISGYAGIFYRSNLAAAKTAGSVH
ncbi:hypothetical protein AB4Y45_35275 [Paraburkholderia sp. EG287A]|uniref:hypothetical protein n=1 Tax=Paraburkholderia sp. EG287A TaxID=3237012 RepID=UPI0034D30555